ncbi:MAG: ADP-ribosylglycohydrolase family protein [Planctomycetota bacterium]
MPDGSQASHRPIESSHESTRADRIHGSLLGTAIGDALGLPYEGLTSRRAKTLLGPPDRYRLWPGRGLLSDDTEHAAMVIEAYVASRADPRTFAAEMGRRMRAWFLALPAGVGLATARASIRLCVGVDPSRSGVWSAGNGPAMRAPILGVLEPDRERLRELVTASARLTHTDPRADQAAYAVALAAWWEVRGTGSHDDFWRELRTDLERNAPSADASQFLDTINRVTGSLENGRSTTALVEALGSRNGISGYALHTVPAVLHVWASNQESFEHSIRTIIECGGDTDTTAAILGGILGARGSSTLPEHLVDGLGDWPRSRAWMEGLATAAAECSLEGHRGVGWLQQLCRNLPFLALVLGHGVRRLLPPYGFRAAPHHR